MGEEKPEVKRKVDKGALLLTFDIPSGANGEGRRVTYAKDKINIELYDRIGVTKWSSVHYPEVKKKYPEYVDLLKNSAGFSVDEQGVAAVYLQKIDAEAA